MNNLAMKKRVYGAIGVKATMAAWNLGFDHAPKSLSNGTIYASDKSLKYSARRLWSEEGEKIIYFKQYKSKKETKGANKGLMVINPMSLEEKYEAVFGNDKNQDKIATNLFNATDVKNFGATFAVKGVNLSITGAVQIGQGLNLYEDTEVNTQSILSPFRDPTKDAKNNTDDKNDEKKGDEAKNSSLGSMSFTDEAHYMYPFVINPHAYDNYVELGVTDGYTEEDYLGFKKAAIVCATAQATCSKEGCENEFVLFIETEPDLYLPNLTDYMTFEKGEDNDKNTIDLGNCADILKLVADRVLSVEIYYNPYTTQIKFDYDNVKYFNIISQTEM